VQLVLVVLVLLMQVNAAATRLAETAVPVRTVLMDYLTLVLVLAVGREQTVS
jgi:hypothetical protein